MATSVPLIAHRHADVGLLQRRGVVHAVAGHRHHLAAGLEGLDDPQLVLRRDAGEHADLGGDPLPARGVQAGQLAAVGGPQRPAVRVAVQAELPADLGGRRLLVAGDHHGADARLPARLDGGLRLLPQRVDHADQPDEHEPARQVLLAVALRQVLVRQGQDAQRRAWPAPRCPPAPACGPRASSAGRPRRSTHRCTGLGQRSPGAPLT